jgi:hypothetical protein
MLAQPKNPCTWVEIYVEDMSRAQKFYETILPKQLSELPMSEEMGDLKMISFHWAEEEKTLAEH